MSALTWPAKVFQVLLFACLCHTMQGNLSWLKACWDDSVNGHTMFRGTDFLHSPLLDELKALEARVTAEFAVNVPSALVVDR